MFSAVGSQTTLSCDPEIPARGKNGVVTLLNSSVLRRNVHHVRGVVNEIDPEAFITAEDVRPVWRGFWRA